MQPCVDRCNKLHVRIEHVELSELSLNQANRRNFDVHDSGFGTDDFNGQANAVYVQYKSSRLTFEAVNFEAYFRVDLEINDECWLCCNLFDDWLAKELCDDLLGCVLDDYASCLWADREDTWWANSRRRTSNDWWQADWWPLDADVFAWSTWVVRRSSWDVDRVGSRPWIEVRQLWLDDTQLWWIHRLQDRPFAFPFTGQMNAFVPWVCNRTGCSSSRPTYYRLRWLEWFRRMFWLPKAW